MWKSGSWLLLVKCLKNMFLKHFAGKNQLPGLSVSGTLVEDGLNLLVSIAHIELLALFWNRS